MLILSRKVNESLLIDDNIRITVTSIRGNRVRLGIEAPAKVRILRSGLLDSRDLSAAHRINAEASLN